MSPAILSGPSAADVFDAPVWDLGDQTHLARLDQRANRRALVTINGLLHSGETSLDLLARRAEAMRHDPFTADTSLVLGLVDGRCESAGESLFWYLCSTQHLPTPTPQFEVRDRHGRVVAQASQTMSRADTRASSASWSVGISWDWRSASTRRR